MLDDGLYELFYRAETEGGDGYDSLLLALRSGRILGSDRWGGVLFGHCVYDEAKDQHHIQLRMQVPPGGMLVTDAEPRDEGDLIEFKADIAAGTDSHSGVVELAGQPVRFVLTFRGRVPR